MNSTLDALTRLVRLDPEAPALRDADTHIGYGALYARARALADELRAHRVGTLALIADNSIDWIVADLASQLASVVVVPIPTFFSPAQVGHAIKDSGAGALASDRPLPDAVDGRLLARIGAPGTGLSLYRVAAGGHEVQFPATTAKISYTSGTTGEPKGACLSQHAMDSVAESLRIATSGLALQRHLCALPLALLLENVAGVLAPIRAGMEICVPRLDELGWTGAAGFDAAVFLRCLERYRPDSLILVPQMLSDIVRSLEQGAEPPRGLKFVAVGGGHIAAALLDKAIAHGLPVHEGYGLTESASVVALTSPNQMRRGSVGRPLAHARVRVSTSHEIMVSGASFLGYVGQPENDHDEVATGDLGYIDDEGYLYVSGRKKNVYITSFGRNVSPEWIEAELVDESTISQAAVFGDRRPWSTAVIVMAPTAVEEDIDAAMSRVNERLPDYAQIGDWIAAKQPFLPSNGLATSNGRNRRDAIWRRYASEIDARYNELVAQNRIA